MSGLARAKANGTALSFGMFETFTLKRVAGAEQLVAASLCRRFVSRRGFRNPRPSDTVAILKGANVRIACKCHPDLIATFQQRLPPLGVDLEARLRTRWRRDQFFCRSTVIDGAAPLSNSTAKRSTCSFDRRINSIPFWKALL